MEQHAFFAMMARLKWIDRWALMRNSSNETLEEELDRFLACGNAAIMVCDVDSANNTK